MVEGKMMEGVLKADQVEMRDQGGERILQYLCQKGSGRKKHAFINYQEFSGMMKL